MPLYVAKAALIGLATLKSHAMQRAGLAAEMNQVLEESEQVVVLFDERPVEPAQRAVLAVGVVIAELGTSDLVAGHDHRHALREQEDSGEVLDLPAPERLHGAIVCLAFNPTVPAVVLVVPVAITLAVGLVVLLVVADNIVEGEAIVAGDEIDAVDRKAPGVLVNVGASGDAGCHQAHHAPVAADESPRAVAVHAVPLRPAEAREVADLVQARGVPSLSDDLAVGQLLGQLDVPEHRRGTPPPTRPPPRQ